jgi:hypothetical protein
MCTVRLAGGTHLGILCLVALHKPPELNTWKKANEYQ